MTTVLDTLDIENQINEQDFDCVAKLVFHSFLVDTNEQNDGSFDKKEDLLTCFSAVLEKCLELGLVFSTKDKLAIINFIDKINLQKELLALKKNETSASQIKLAGERLGKKSQSAFQTNG